MRSIRLPFTPRRWHWLLLSLVILVCDYLTGPFIQFPVLFVLPVSLAARVDGVRWAIAAAVVLPLIRLSFAATWGVPATWFLAAVDALIDTLILIGFALLIHRFFSQQRELRVLQGLLPICSFCKRIRTEDREWQPLERFISDRSEAMFSHSICPECGERQYPGYLE